MERGLGLGVSPIFGGYGVERALGASVGVALELGISDEVVLGISDGVGYRVAIGVALELGILDEVVLGISDGIVLGL